MLASSASAAVDAPTAGTVTTIHANIDSAANGATRIRDRRHGRM